MHLFRSTLFPAVAISAAIATLAIASPAAAQIDSAAKADTSKLMVNMDQGLRGREAFNKTCLECHTKSDISGQDFKIKWSTRPVWDLFDVIKTTMPDDKPGSLTQEQYIDVVAYLLRVNGAQFGGPVLVATDTATLKKWKMDIVVPSPNVDSAKARAIRQFGAHPVVKSNSSGSNSTPARIGVNSLFTRQANKH